MIQKLSFKLIVCSLLCSTALQACASFQSRQQLVESIEKKLNINVTPLKVSRLSVIYVPSAKDYPVVTGLVDLTLNFLKNRQPGLTVVEREAVAAVQKEFAYQLEGNVSTATMAQIGQHVGADALLLVYFKPMMIDEQQAIQNNGGLITASMDLRLVHVEDGTDLFRTSGSASAIYPPPPPGKYWLPDTIKKFHDVLSAYTAAFELASLATAFGENAIGFVPDMDGGISALLPKDTRPGISVWGMLEGSPAQKIGLRRFDRIVKVNGHPYNSWTDKIQLPAVITVDHAGKELVLSVQ